MTLPVFAYGSNMSVRRITARVKSARPMDVGYVAGRRLAFHKRGVDGSGKADAVLSSDPDSRVWGVLFEISPPDHAVLDQYEPGYERHPVRVVGRTRERSAILYSARTAKIDPSLRPFCWYHRFVIQGAIEHELPEDYLRFVRSFETVPDPDASRRDQYAALLNATRAGQDLAARRSTGR